MSPVRPEFASSYTSTDIDKDPIEVMHTLASLHPPVKSSFMSYDVIRDVHGACFEVPARCEGQKLTLLGREESSQTARKNSNNDEEFPQFLRYGPALRLIMEKLGYDLTNRPGLNYGKGRRTLPRSFIPKEKAPGQHHRKYRGLGCATTPTPSDSDSEECDYHDHSSGTSSWESDVSIGDIFEGLSVNMVSASSQENEDTDNNGVLIGPRNSQDQSFDDNK